MHLAWTVFVVMLLGRSMHAELALPPFAKGQRFTTPSMGAMRIACSMLQPFRLWTHRMHPSCIYGEDHYVCSESCTASRKRFTALPLMGTPLTIGAT